MRLTRNSFLYTLQSMSSSVPECDFYTQHALHRCSLFLVYYSLAFAIDLRQTFFRINVNAVTQAILWTTRE